MAVRKNENSISSHSTSTIDENVDCVNVGETSSCRNKEWCFVKFILSLKLKLSLCVLYKLLYRLEITCNEKLAKELSISGTVN